jgi:hypothetical protein
MHKGAKPKSVVWILRIAFEIKFINYSVPLLEYDDPMSALPSTVDDSQNIEGVRALKRLSVEQFQSLDQIDLMILSEPMLVEDEIGEPLVVVFPYALLEQYEAIHTEWYRLETEIASFARTLLMSIHRDR